MGSCLGIEEGAQEAEASGMSSDIAAMVEVVPYRVAEVVCGEMSLHPNDSVVQLRVLRYHEGIQWEGVVSGFVLKDAQPNCIISLPSVCLPTLGRVVLEDPGEFATAGAWVVVDILLHDHQIDTRPSVSAQCGHACA
jgi:hypothetical protein